METINHECYVSLEIAKLLKKAGFDWKIFDGYILYEDGGSFVTKFQTPHNFNGNNGELFNNYLHHKEILSRPTLAVAQRWLREVKKYHIYVRPYSLDDETYVTNIVITDSIWGSLQDDNKKAIIFKTYEDALEAGIKKCLEEDCITDKCSEE